MITQVLNKKQDLLVVICDNLILFQKVMNKISDRRKLTHGQSIFNQDDDSSLFRANTTVTIVNSTPPTID